MLVCGLGTGRCGTKSLAELLRRNGFDAGHERRPVLAWSGEPDPCRHFRDAPENFADVGFYYLPHVRELMAEFKSLRFVCLRRTQEETIDSFCRMRPAGTHWFSEEGEPNPWDHCFPKYGVEFQQAVARYWRDYYRSAEQLQGLRFRIYPTESLNCPRCVEGILRFVGVERPKVITGICLKN